MYSKLQSAMGQVNESFYFVLLNFRNTEDICGNDLEHSHPPPDFGKDALWNDRLTFDSIIDLLKISSVQNILFNWWERLAEFTERFSKNHFFKFSILSVKLFVLLFVYTSEIYLTQNLSLHKIYPSFYVNTE